MTAQTPAPVPAWLDLSAIVADELTAEIFELATAVEAIGQEHDELFQRCAIALTAVEKAINEAESGVPSYGIDGFFDLLIGLTGGARLYEALLRLGSQVDAAGGNSASPDNSFAPPWASGGFTGSNQT